MVSQAYLKPNYTVRYHTGPLNNSVHATAMFEFGSLRYIASDTKVHGKPFVGGHAGLL